MKSYALSESVTMKSDFHMGVCLSLREAFKNYLQKTFGIFHMLVDPLPPYMENLVSCRKHMENDPTRHMEIADKTCAIYVNI